MKTPILTKRFTLCWLFCACLLESRGQGTLGNGTFQNLDFESATIVPVSGQPFFIQAGPALPGWTSLLGSTVQNQILYNTRTTGAAGITLSGSGGALDGNYSVILQGADLFVGQDASILQTGTIPAGANSIQFASINTIPGTFSVSVNGLPINVQVLLRSSSNSLRPGKRLACRRCRCPPRHTRRHPRPPDNKCFGCR